MSPFLRYAEWMRVDYLVQETKLKGLMTILQQLVWRDRLTS